MPELLQFTSIVANGLSYILVGMCFFVGFLRVSDSMVREAEKSRILQFVVAMAVRMWDNIRRRQRVAI